MRRLPAVWYYNGTAVTFTDITQLAGQGVPYGQPTSAVTLQPGDILYCGGADWLAGLCLFIDNNLPAGTPTIVAEVCDGASDKWIAMPTRERFDDLFVGSAVVNPGYDLTTSGVLEWVVDEGTSWVARIPDPNTGLFGDAPLPVGNPSQLYWVRLRNTGTVALSIDRVLPVYYNTYTNPTAIAHYLGGREFNDIDHPRLASIRERIRTQEDVLDDYLRATYRIGMQINERQEFNPFGTRLHYRPVIKLVSAGVWTGTTFQQLFQGRGQDYYFDPEMGMEYYTRISVGRGLPWSRASSRYMRQPAAAFYTYIYGGDFDLCRRRGIIRDIIINRVAASLAITQDAHVYFRGSGDLVPKPEKVQLWQDAATEKAMQIRGLLVV